MSRLYIICVGVKVVHYLCRMMKTCSHGQIECANNLYTRDKHKTLDFDFAIRLFKSLPAFPGGLLNPYDTKTIEMIDL